MYSINRAALTRGELMMLYALESSFELEGVAGLSSHIASVLWNITEFEGSPLAQSFLNVLIVFADENPKIWSEARSYKPQ